MSLRSGSSRRKPQVTHKVNQKSARNEDDEDEDEEVELSSGLEEGEVHVVKRNGKDEDQTDDDIEVIPDLPEGTVIVNPEPVDDRPKNSGVRKQRGAAFNSDSVSKSFLARVTCTACGKQVNPHIYGAARRHPHVRALICKKCYKFYKSGEITKDKDGLDEQCRWCGEGGKLFGCDYCHNVFCKACIQRNFGRGELSNVDVDQRTSLASHSASTSATCDLGDAKWKCYICSPHKMADLIEHCNKVLDYMEQEREKEKEMAKKEKQQTKSFAPKAESENLQHNSFSTKSEPGGSSIVGPSKMFQSNFSSRGPQVSPTTIVQQQKPVPVKLEIVHKTSSQTFDVMRTGRSQISQPTVVLGERVIPPPIVQISNSSMNDLKRCLLNVNANNVQDKIDKFITVVKSMSLMLEAIKTDLAIAQLSGQFNYAARCNAVTSLSTGMEVFFNAYKEILGNPPPLAQVATEPQSKLAAPVVNGNRYKNETSTPIVTRYIKDVKKELNISAIPIMIDESDEGGESPKKTTRINSSSVEPCGKSQSIVSLPIEDDDDAETEKNPAKGKSTEGSSKSPSKPASSVNSEDIKWQEKSKSNKEINENHIDEDCSEEEDDDDERKPRGKIKMKFKKMEKKKEMDEDTENLSKLEDKLKSVIDSIEKENEKEISDETDTGSSKEWTRSRKSRSSQEKVEKENKDGSAKIAGSGDNSENIAAQLELLKEMADELSEKTEKAEMNSQQDDSATETEETNEEDRISNRKEKKEEEEEEEDGPDLADGRKSDIRRSRRKKSHDNSVRDKKNVEEEDVNVKSKKGRSSKCGKFEKEEDDLSAKRKGKSGKKVESRDVNEETDDGKSKRRKQTRTENEGKNLSGERTSSNRSKEEKIDESNSDSDDDDSSEEEETRRRTRRSRKGKAAGKKSEKKKECKSDSENYDSELEQEIEKFEKEPVLRRSSRRIQEVEKDGKDKKCKEDQKSKSEQKLKGGKKSKKEEDDESLSIGSDNDSNEDEEEEEEEDNNTRNIVDAENEAAKLALLHEANREDKEQEAEEDIDEDNEEDFEMPSSDSEVTFTPRKTRGSKTRDKESKKAAADDSDDSNHQPIRKTRLRSKLLGAKLSESDSEDDEEGKKKTRKGKEKGIKRKKESSEDDDYRDAFDDDDGSDIEGPMRKKKGRKRTRESSDEESESDSSSKKRSYRQKGKKRRRIKLLTNSSDEDAEDQETEEKVVDKKQESGNEGEDDDDEEGGHSFLKRRRIRKLMSNKKLAEETKQARKAEEERRKRIEERQKQYNNYIEVEDEEKEGTEEGKKILGSPVKCPVTTKLVMQVDEKTKEPIIEMDRTLVRKLKPHQVEAVQFMWNCCVENVDRLKKEEGSGCILAHCMGLGKTLSVISFLHMMMSNQKLTRIKCCLVVCPLNTVLNWQREFEMWQEDLHYQMDVYELSLVKQNFARADRLQDWHENGGVMIMGYDMYRRLATGHKQKKKGFAKKKRLCEIFQETLVDPGPDIVVCDEGHILKNDSSAISKAMSEIKTKRRITLTGTPLQNNLGEYHCMVNFVKTNLLGTRREFANRFINPITNGQCSDSTPYDVKIMKRRAHILHEMLAGCVQRKDYSALTKFLPPKFEYVISVRLSKVQIELYEKYLELSLRNTDGVVTGRGGRLFTDYQFLMRIWTHPWVLKLDEIRQENRRMYDSEDSFIDDEAETDEESDMSFIDNSSEVSGEENSDTIDSDDDGRRKARDKQKKTEDENKDEIVKKWTTRSRRGDEDGAGPSQPLKEEEFQFDKGVSSEWWAEYVKEEDKFKMDTGGKLVLLFQILKMCENIGDKVLVFSQSLLSLDIIEDFLEFLDSQAQKEHEENLCNVDDKEKKEEKEGEKVKDDELKEFGKNWSKGVDYFRLDGSTNPQNRKKYADSFNDIENYRARLFLISTKAGSLGINLVAANRVIIFDASWNPSHDIQSMFRVYRFGQEKPVYIYRFLAQGTMEEKIYERQVTKQSLSLRVIDENQIERHFSASDLQELYTFRPDRLDDPNRKEKPTPKLPKDVLLAELLQSHKDWIVGYHDHDSLLENIEEDKLTEEERKAAWEEYEEEKKGIRVQNLMVQPGFGMPPMPGAYNQGFSGWHGGMFPQGLPNLGPNGLLQIVNDLKIRFPGMPPELFQQRVQAVLRQLLAQQIMQQQEAQRRQVEQRQLQELQRLNQIKQQIQRQRQQIAVQQSQMGLSSLSPLSMYGAAQPLPTLNTNMPTSSTLSSMLLGQNVPRSQPKS